MAEATERTAHDASGTAVDTVGRILPFPSLGPASCEQPEPRLRDVIGEVLRDERHAQERTLADVADAAAVSLPYLSEVERGVKEVSSDLLAAICESLDLPLDVVLERGARRLRSGGGSGVTMLAA